MAFPFDWTSFYLLVIAIETSIIGELTIIGKIIGIKKLVEEESPKLRRDRWT